MIVRRFRSLIVTATLAGMGESVLHAQRGTPDLKTASIEELMNIQVTSAARKEQRVAEVAAAVYVITQEQIRRSGLTSVPEILRLAPGVQVAHIDASKWAVSIRGFNNRWSDKLLVLVDGRTLYNRQFSGVYWDSVNVMLEDIERIEVVRGPGGSVWGANAVDGVINVITKSSAETQGGLARASIGTQDEGGGAFRYGGTADALTYRIQGDWEQRGHFTLDDGAAAPDRWRTFTSGARADWKRGDDQLLIDGGLQRVDTNSFAASIDNPVPPPGGWQPRVQQTDLTGGHVLGRWTRNMAGGRSLALQAFVDHTDRQEEILRYRWTTVDVDAQYHALVRGRHDIVGGAGYRRTSDRFDGSFAVSISPVEADLSIVNTFLQDEIRLVSDHLRLTLGAKVEHETLSGWGVQPTARALWTVGPNQHVWAAISRALRTPARADRGLRVNLTSFPGPTGLPVLLTLQGNPDYQSEDLMSTEAGFRWQGTHVSFDVATFYSHFDKTQSQEPITPHVEIFGGQPVLVTGTQFANLRHADASGVELSTRWSPVEHWHVDANYTFFDLSPQSDPASRDEHIAEFDGSAPRHQWQLRPAATFGRIDTDLAVARVGALETFGVAAYTRLDARLEWRATPHWSLSVTGQNLTDHTHVEFGGLENATTVTRDTRRVTGMVTWRY